MNQKEGIVLTGFMGSGKSAVGRILANRLSRSFIDLDHLIEKHEKMSISNIFAEHGEACFRKLELEYLQKVIVADSCVIALGGGALQQQEVMNLVQHHAILIYLKVPEETLLNRLKKDKKRPMLHDSQGHLLDETGLRNKIRSLIRKREPCYQKADITVSVKPHWMIHETANEIARSLHHHAPTAFPEND